jgi:hypothetical protein
VAAHVHDFEERLHAAARETVEQQAHQNRPPPLVAADDPRDIINDLLSSSYYLRQWGRIGINDRRSWTNSGTIP